MHNTRCNKSTHIFLNFFLFGTRPKLINTLLLRKSTDSYTCIGTNKFMRLKTFVHNLDKGGKIPKSTSTIIEV